MPEVARVDDTIDHGGHITDGSPDVFVNGRKLARLDDPVICDIHGAQHISSASTKTFANTKGWARKGDSISCGAVINSGSSDTFEG